MKKKLTFLALILAMSFGLNKSFAQKNVIKLNPLSIFVLTGNVQYERAINDKISLQLGGFFGNVGLGFGVSEGEGDYNYTWFGITPEMRYYATHASRSAPAGFYMGPFVRYRQANVDFDVTVSDPNTGFETVAAEAKVSAISPGVILGYQFLLGDVVALDFFLGPMFNIGDIDATVKATGESAEYGGIGFSGLGLRSGFSIGVAF